MLMASIFSELSYSLKGHYFSIITNILSNVYMNSQGWLKLLIYLTLLELQQLLFPVFIVKYLWVLKNLWEYVHFKNLLWLGQDVLAEKFHKHLHRWSNQIESESQRRTDKKCLLYKSALTISPWFCQFTFPLENPKVPGFYKPPLILLGTLLYRPILRYVLFCLLLLYHCLASYSYLSSSS